MVAGFAALDGLAVIFVEYDYNGTENHTGSSPGNNPSDFQPAQCAPDREMSRSKPDVPPCSSTDPQQQFIRYAPTSRKPSKTPSRCNTPLNLPSVATLMDRIQIA